MERKGGGGRNNDKKNDPYKPHLVAASPGSIMGDEETTCASSVEESSSRSTTIAVNINHDEQQQQRQALTNQITHLAIASGGSMVVFILATIPVPILVGMAMILFLLSTLLRKLYQRAVLEYQTTILQGRGVAQYLPESITSQLVHISIHEWMMDGSFMQENAYLALYFIPGISSEQIDMYIDRLLPRHQQALRRPGLGHLFGNDFMRLLVGDQGGNHDHNPQRIPANHHDNGGIPARINPRRLELLPEHNENDDDNDDDDASGFLDTDDAQSQYARFFGLAVDDEPLSTPMAGAVVAQATFETASSNDDEHDNDKSDDDTEDPTLEMTILSDAVTAGINNYYNMALGMAAESAVSVTSVFRGTIMRTSLTVTLLGASIGTLGLWAGAYDPQTLLRSIMPPGGAAAAAGRGLFSFPSSSLLMSTTLASAGTASLMMMFGWRVGNNNNNNPKSNSDDDNKKDNSKKRG